MRWKLVIRSAGGLLVLVGLLYIGYYALEWRRANIASAFVEQVRHLEAGKTTESQIKGLAAQYGGQLVEAHQEDGILQPTRYDFGIVVPYALVAGSARTLPGRRFWGLLASLEVEDGYLSNLYLSLTVLRSDDFELLSTVRLTSTRRLISPDGAPYYVHEAHITGLRGEALGVKLSPAASTEERRKGFDFNLSCLTALRECRHVCDTFPSVWKDLTPRDRLTYEDGTPVNDYRECGRGTR
jgi:hypothetical protein